MQAESARGPGAGGKPPARPLWGQGAGRGRPRRRGGAAACASAAAEQALWSTALAWWEQAAVREFLDAVNASCAPDVSCSAQRGEDVLVVRLVNSEGAPRNANGGSAVCFISCCRTRRTRATAKHQSYTRVSFSCHSST